jgi:hypothetical protein
VISKIKPKGKGLISRPEEDSPVNLLQKTGGTGVRVIAKARWKGKEAGQN